jgi:ABC-type lipoprotein export system ATPase subunit
VTQAVVARGLEMLYGSGPSEVRALWIVTHDARIAGVADRVVHLIDGALVKPIG